MRKTNPASNYQSSTLVNRPSTSSARPSTSSTQPSSLDSRPSTSSARPSTSSTQPSSLDSRPSTSSARPSTSSTQPSSLDSRPSTSSPSPSPRVARQFRFERIEAWQLARALNRKVYAVTRQFPKDEQFGLTSQLRRASVSVSSNIAEGSGRNSDVDFAHFLEIAYGSLMESVSQLFLAVDENYLNTDSFDSLLADADLLAGKIAALSKSLGRVSRIAQPSTLVNRPSTSSARPSTSSTPPSSSQPSTLVNRPSTD
jgi:four helix bundle protein